MCDSDADRANPELAAGNDARQHVANRDDTRRRTSTMYDMKAEPNEFVGDDRAEAVAKAARFFQVEESELEINEPAAGVIYGAGARAVIVAYAPSKRSSAPQRDGGRGERDRGRGRGRDRDRDRGDHDRDRGERRESRARRDGRDGNRNGGGRDREERPERSRERASAEESKGSLRGAVGPIGDFLVGVLERMQIGSFEISEESEGDFLIYQLRGRAAQELGSGDGRAADAIQLLANQAAMREMDESTRVIVDAEVDDDRRESFLERLAERAAGRAIDTRRSVALDPMNPKDRRILHVTVREIDDVVTMSVGEGRYRQVVIVPKGASEYEEALEASNEASSRSQD